MDIEAIPENNTAAIQAAINQVCGEGGGTVRLLPGTHYAGTLRLQSI